MSALLQRGSEQGPSDSGEGQAGDAKKFCGRSCVSLGSRLLLCASMVRPFSKVADIGTDHAYLPIYLVQNGIICSAIAADVREKPLKTADTNIEHFVGRNKIITRLSNGLEGILPTEADDIIIAGMGGKNIINIIENAPWVKDKKKHLILQPMTSEPELRVFLSNEGFSVIKEKAAEEDRHIYTAMLVSFNPQNTAKGELFPYIGAIKPDTHENREYISKQLHRLKKRSEGLRISGKKREAENIEGLISEIQNIIN